MSLPTISGIPMPNANSALTTAGAFLQAFNESSQLALEKERQASDLQMRDHQMQRQDQLMAWEGEDRQYQNDVLRPLQEQQMRLGNASQILGLQSQSADIRYREEMTRAASLRTGSSTAIWDSFNNDPRIKSGLDAGLRLFGGQGMGAPAGQAMGKATRYGYANDSTPDSNSSAGIGAWVSTEEQARIKAGEQTPNRLRPGDLALSPDVEKAMRMAGIRPGQAVAIQYADGSEHAGRWMDRTASEYQGKKLTGRFDVYDPDGSYADRDGHPVVSFRRADAPDAAPVTASQVQTMRDADSLLDSYEAAQEYVQRFTGQDSRGNPVLDPRARPIAEQAFAMETAIKANPMLANLAKQRVEQRQETAASQAVVDTIQYYQPGQLEDFRMRQPGAFNVLQRWNMGQQVPLADKLRTAQMLQEHAAGYKPGQNAAKPLPASALTMLQTIGVAQAMQRPQDLPDPSDKEGKRKIAADPKAVAAWEKAQADAAGAQTALAAMAMYDPSVAEVYQRVFPPAQKPAAVGGVDTSPASNPSAPSIPAKRITTSAERKEAADSSGNAAKWTEAKQSFGKAIELDYPDSGSEDPEANAALALAMDIYANSGPKRGDYRGPEGRNKALKAAGWDGYEKAFDDTSRWGLDAVKRHEVVKFWAEDTLRKYGYLSQGDNAQQRKAQDLPRVQTDADYDALPSGAQYRDPSGNTRTKL